LFRRVPHHQQLARKGASADSAFRVRRQLQLLNRFLGPQKTFMEVGAGDCAVTVAVAPRVRRAYGVDVSPTIVGDAMPPANLQLLVLDGYTIPALPEAVDVVFSNQVMEHLHSD